MNSSETCELIVVRHGETAWNAEGRQQGHMDIPLNERGLLQSQAIARRLQSVSFTALYSSDLARAAQTAQLIADATGHAIAFDQRLRERDLGVFEGLTKAEIAVQFAQEFDQYENGGLDYVIPQGESIRQRFERSILCLDEIAAKHRGERIVVVTHGGVLNGVLRQSLQVPLEAPRGFAIFNAAFTRFDCKAKQWRLLTWGDISHLENVGSQDDP